MSKKKQHQHISGLISETLRLLCKSGLTYKTNFSIDALIGITLDEDEVFLVNIKETVDEKGSDNDSHAESLSEESSLEEAVTQDADGSAKKARKRKRKRNSLSRSQDVASPLAKIQKPEDKGAVREVPGTPVSEGTVKETDKPTDRTQETTKTTTDDVDSTTEPSGPTNDTITSESQDKETQRTTGKPDIPNARAPEKSGSGKVSSEDKARQLRKAVKEIVAKSSSFGEVAEKYDMDSTDLARNVRESLLRHLYSPTEMACAAIAVRNCEMSEGSAEYLYRINRQEIKSVIEDLRQWRSVITLKKHTSERSKFIKSVVEVTLQYDCSEQAMLKAMRKVIKEGVTLGRACQLYKVPLDALAYRVAHFSCDFDAAYLEETKPCSSLPVERYRSKAPQNNVRFKINVANALENAEPSPKERVETDIGISLVLKVLNEIDVSKIRTQTGISSDAIGSKNRQINRGVQAHTLASTSAVTTQITNAVPTSQVQQPNAQSIIILPPDTKPLNPSASKSVPIQIPTSSSFVSVAPTPATSMVSLVGSDVNVLEKTIIGDTSVAKKFDFKPKYAWIDKMFKTTKNPFVANIDGAMYVITPKPGNV